MKLELPDNNASVLFHMGNALQSIASDLDAAYVQNAKEVRELINSGKPETKRLEISDIVAAVKASLDEAVELGLIGKPELSDTVDEMIESVAADWKVPINRLTGNTNMSDALITPPEAEFTEQQAIDHTSQPTDTIDADGLPWDQRINSKGRTRIKGDVWRARQKPNDKSDEEWAEYVEGVKTELKALMAIPVATGAELDVLANIPVITAEQRAELKVHIDYAEDPNEVDPFAIEPPVVDAIVTPPVVDAVVTPPVVDAVVTPPVDAAVTGPTTFPELMKFITVNNKKLTKDSVDEALKAQGLASIALLAARTDLIPQVHAALVKLL